MPELSLVERMPTLTWGAKNQNEKLSVIAAFDA
jgi:hypothetical protein